MALQQLDAEHVLTFTAHTDRAMVIPAGPQGTRGVIGVTGGTFEGPRLNGTVVPPGGDWFTIRTNGTLRIDVRLLLAVDDGANILLTYTGVAVPREGGGMDIRVAALFEAPEGPHAWLNDIQAVGRGSLVDGGVRYELYALA